MNSTTAHSHRPSAAFTSHLLMLVAFICMLPSRLLAQEIVSPVPGTTLASSTVTFTVSPAPTATWFLDIGTTGQGSDNIHSGSGNAAFTTTQTITGVPTNQTIYVTLWRNGSFTSRVFYTYGPAPDQDDDGIFNAIDPNPTVANAKTALTPGSDFALTILGSGRVASMESATLFPSTAGDPNTAQVQAVATRLYQRFKDDFDFLFVAANRSTPGPSATAAGIHYAVSNTVGGIGQGTFNGTAAYGSQGKLQSYLYLATLDGLTRGPSLHELMHRWGNNLSPVIPGAPGDSGHWGYSSVGGQLGGYKAGTRELVSGNTYRARSPRTGNFGGWGTFANGGNGLPYSQLELYLMGMIDKSAVTDALEVANGVTNFNSSTGVFDATSFTAVSMADITAAKGDRNPLSTTSQKNFRVMMVVLTDVPLTNAQWATADEAVESFSRTASDGTSGYNFWEATNGIGSLNMANLNAAVAAPALTGVPITPTAVITTSQWDNPGFGGHKDKIINGDGLTGGGSVLTQVHDSNVNVNSWHAGLLEGGISGGTTGNPPAVNTQAVEFDLGGNYDLTGTHIWNFNAAGFIGRGVKDVQILVSSSTTGAFTALTTTQFTQASGLNTLTAQVVPLSASNVRRVRFAIQSAWSGAANEYVGLSEVRFQGTAAATVPGAPVIGTATAGNASASVTFTAPASNGGSNITGYTVTSSPGGITATGATSPINVTGLTNGTAYTFTVRATNAAGPGAASAASNSVTPSGGGSTVDVTVAGTGLGAIPDGDLGGGNGAPLDISFNVTGRTGVVQGVSLQFTLNPAHTYASDLSVQLIAPDNTIAQVFQVTDDQSDLGGPYTFQDSATGSLVAAVLATGDSTVASGSYRAANGGTLTVLNTVFANKAPNGTWKLRFIDNSVIDTGTVSQASLTLTTTAAAPQCAIVMQINGNRQLTLTDGLPNTNYLLRRSTNLTSWSALATVTTNASGTATHTDATTRQPTYFYFFELVAP